MLAKIREKTQGIIATFILSLIAFTFVIWGIGSYFHRGSVVAVANVNGTEISQQAYRERLQAFHRANPTAAENPVVKNMLVERLISETLLVSDVGEHGYRVGGAQIAQTIEHAPPFQSGGQYQPILYQEWLRGQGLTAGQYEMQLRQTIAAYQLERGLSDSAFVTDADVAATIRLLKQERRVSYATVSTDAFLPKVSIDAKEIEDYYRANQESLRAPEAVRVEYLTLRAADLAQQVQPTEEELRQAYNAEAARYVTPEKRKASHILISVPPGANESADKAARARIDDVAKQLRAGGNFAALAKKYSDDQESGKKGGELDDTSQGVIPPELEAALKSLKVGEISAPVRTVYGYHLVKLTGVEPEKRRSFESVKPELAAQVRRRKAEERFYELGERFRNLVYEHPEGLQPAAKELGLSVQTSDWFTRAGGPGIAAQPRVVSAAFEPEVLNRERNTDAIEASNDALVALHVVDHRPAAIRPLAEVRPQIERVLKENRAREQARAAAEEWVKKIEQGGKFADFGRASGGATVTPNKVLTREQPGGVDKRLLDAVFAAPRPADKPIAGSVDLGRVGYAVYALEAVRDADPATVDAALKDRIKHLLAQRRGADYYDDYRSGLRKAADVTVYGDQL